MNDLKYWLAFSQITRIGAQKIKLLKQHFPNMEQAWKASEFELREAGLERSVIAELSSRRSNINPDLELEKLNKEDIKIVTIDDPAYPILLKQTYSAPFLLYYKGDLANLHSQTVAVVGTRKMSTYGQQVTQKIVQELVSQDVIVVSGLALGVDALAHTTCVNERKITIAVLGSGLDRQNIYPATNRTLAENILQTNGLIVSEYPIGMMPLRHNFPARNRIISGLSLGTLVIEAGETSGALITAKFALEQNREVFAIPGQINHPMSIGTNNLIKQGAKLVQSAEDIFEELQIKELKQQHEAKQVIPDSAEEGAILKHLLTEPLHINELVKLSDLTTQEVNSTLMMLEMKGKVKNLGNNSYIANI
ncbi:DNA-protecting protein DprA [Candidatus Falkowbacteria bacterium]|mgnify:CR=1 FL=1|jgi:DNA processing protein|nr:DNA-protecting protein DprA [Candidatus Falkowbacteria bacterium]MBT5503617.1 DNA-protecting protein DprA [Candidatus Falkowbacteria bacterium]MBT6574477.1 DNA-protecting protein DprA [Candidatus Falkowbacteria bacterium]MBT7348101.1 DNA-protecting protein DprA [Candidatus Falkowbacteria bacterium]MBT7500744.1 DNA-protecting protein DprA [Candidatus Falkowbacteria bacterium]